MRYIRILHQASVSLLLAVLLTSLTFGSTYANTSSPDGPISIHLTPTIRIDNASDSGRSIADRMTGELQCSEDRTARDPLRSSSLKSIFGNPLDLSFRYNKDNRLVFSGKFFETHDGSIQPTKEVLQLATISAPAANDNTELIIEVRDHDSGIVQSESLDASKASRIWSGFSSEFASMYGDHLLATLLEGLGYAAAGAALATAYMALHATPVGWVLDVVVIGLFLWWAIDNGWTFFKMTLANDYEGIGKRLAVELNHLVFAVVGSGCAAYAIGKIPKLGKFIEALRAAIVTGTQGFPNPAPAISTLLSKIGANKPDPDASSSGLTYGQLEAIFRTSTSQPSGMGGRGSFYDSGLSYGGGPAVGTLARPTTASLPRISPQLDLAAPQLAANLRPALTIAPAALATPITNKSALPAPQFSTQILVEWTAYQNYLSQLSPKVAPVGFQKWRLQTQTFSPQVSPQNRHLALQSAMLIGFSAPVDLPIAVEQISEVLLNAGWRALDEINQSIEQSSDQKISFIELTENPTTAALMIGLNVNVTPTLLESTADTSTVFIAPSPASTPEWAAGVYDDVGEKIGEGGSNAGGGNAGNGAPPEAPANTPDGPGDDERPRQVVMLSPYGATDSRIPYSLQICAYGGGVAIVMYLLAKYVF